MNISSEQNRTDSARRPANRTQGRNLHSVLLPPGGHTTLLGRGGGKASFVVFLKAPRLWFESEEQPAVRVQKSPGSQQVESCATAGPSSEIRCCDDTEREHCSSGGTGGFHSIRTSAKGLFPAAAGTGEHGCRPRRTLIAALPPRRAQIGAAVVEILADLRSYQRRRLVLRLQREILTELKDV
ncbi:hypothetical protein GN956_G20386 [Arapaima gigas]